MKRCLFVSLALCDALAVFATTAVAASPKLDADRDTLVAHLKGSAKKLKDAVAGLNQTQLNFKPAPERWSVAECLEHIAASEDFLFEFAKKSLASPATPEKKAERMAKDAMILKMVPDRSKRFQAPEPLRPTNRFTSTKGSMKHFNDSRKTTLEFARSTPDLRSHASPNQAIGEADTYQWVLFVSAHTERHTAQILEVKADPKFPK